MKDPKKSQQQVECANEAKDLAKPQKKNQEKIPKTDDSTAVLS